MFSLYARVRPWIARGYRPVARSTTAAEWVVPPEAAGDGTLVLGFCPTYVAAGNRVAQRQAVEALAAQLAEATASLPGLRAMLTVGMQWSGAERDEAVRRVGDLCAVAARAGVPAAGFAMAGYGKVRSLNEALAAASRLGAGGLLQVDDDIGLDAGCVTALCRAFVARGGRGAVGATKVGLARPGSSSKMLRWLKQQTGPAVDYPHACCMVIDPAALAPGIPARYVSDDGYICFTLLRPHAADPLELLHIVPDATCRHFVGGPAGRSARRVRRLLLNHHVYLADFPEATARYYFEHLLFGGLWPVGAPERVPRQGLPLRWVLRLGYFACFAVVGAELALRGVTGRPLRAIAWAGYDERGAPAPASTSASP